MTQEPRSKADYGARETEAAHRVLVDIGQILGSYFEDSIVIIGGQVPDLLVPNPTVPHVRSMDIDVAMNPKKLTGGKYVEMVKALLDTGRYRRTDKDFRLRTSVVLVDGEEPIPVDIDFLKPPGKWPKGAEKSVPKFRPLDAKACEAAFINPLAIDLKGLNTQGAHNTVHIRVTNLEGFLILKAYALKNRDKPKDAYDISYCLDEMREQAEAIAGSWRDKKDEKLVAETLKIFREKFESISSFGPQQVVKFHDSPSKDERDIQAQNAFQLVKWFLEIVDRP